MTGGAAALERPLAALVMKRVAVDKKSRLQRSGVRCKWDFCRLRTLEGIRFLWAGGREITGRAHRFRPCDEPMGQIVAAGCGKLRYNSNFPHKNMSNALSCALAGRKHIHATDFCSAPRIYSGSRSTKSCATA